MISKQFPDGLVELTMSGKDCPPGFHGQAGNVSSCWFRVNGGPWEEAIYSSLHTNAEFLDAADSVDEFYELVTASE